MQIAEYVKFREHLGDTIIWIDGTPFARYRRWFYTSLPRFRRHSIRPARLRTLLFKGALGVIATSAEPTARSMPYMVCHGPEYDLSHIRSKNRRTQTRQGLKRCEIRSVSWDDMAAKGLAINRQALARQNRGFSNLADAEWWERQCRGSASFPDVLAWGALVNGDLASYVHVIIHDWIENDGASRRVGDIIHFMSGNAHLRDHPNEALIYTVTRMLIVDFRCDTVVIGTASNDPHLYEWKSRMGFRPEPASYKMVVNPALHLAKFFVPKLKLWLDGSEGGAPKVPTELADASPGETEALRPGHLTMGMQSV